MNSNGCFFFSAENIYNKVEITYLHFILRRTRNSVDISITFVLVPPTLDSKFSYTIKWKINK